jgi:diacylglycerol kinase (ATP)
MTEFPNDSNKRGVIGRLLAAFGNSWAGFRHAVLTEAAIRDELVVFCILTPVAVALDITGLERLILVLSMMLVLLVEFLNTAIETTLDRVSTEEHPLTGRAKDLGSAAVFIALMMSALSWVVIVGPILVRLVRR